VSRLDQFAQEFKEKAYGGFDVVETLIRYLDEERSTHAEQWPAVAHACREHELHSLLLEDPYTNRAFAKPRGYAGDGVMLDFVYGHRDIQDAVAQSSEIGRGILAYTGGASPPARAVRWRRGRVAQEIEAIASKRRNIRVLAFACGHLREIELIHPELRRRVRITAADMDEKSLELVANAYQRDGEVECRRISVKDLVANEHEFEHRFDLIYTLGLLDYLSDRVVERLIPIFWSLVASEGKLMIANFTPETQGAAYMEAIMDWWLQYRDADALLSRVELLGSQSVATCESFHDPFGQVAYLSLEKR
jgi:extracellular factor (EF) 3-hydroxypalmitic acid methyl ester biosynthesis protein